MISADISCSQDLRVQHKHITSEPMHVSKEIDLTNKEILNLQAKIVKVKEENEKKVITLVRVHFKELEDLKKENSHLKEEIAMQNISKEQGIGELKEENEKKDSYQGSPKRVRSYIER